MAPNSVAGDGPTLGTAPTERDRDTASSSKTKAEVMKTGTIPKN